jgi:hypothetical protein
VTCNEVKKLLPDYLEGTLTDDEMSFVAQHLHECKDCPKELQSLQALLTQLEARNVKAPPEYYWTTLLPRIHQRIEERKKRRLPVWVPRFVFPMVGAALLVVIAIQVFSPERETVWTETGIRNVLQEMDSTELQQVNIAMYLDNNYANGMNPLSSDTEMLKEMVNDLNITTAFPAYEQNGATEFTEMDNITDEEADLLLDHLDQRRFIN